MILKDFIQNGCGKDIKCVIYKFTNLVNGKIYIGQTKNSLRKRIISHLSQSNNTNKHKKHYFQRALCKYGLESFDIEILETCAEYELNKREIYWINHFDTTNPRLGYNCTYGGQGNRNAYVISEDTRQKISEFHKNIWKDPKYRQRQHNIRSQITRARYKRTILQLDFNGDIVNTWSNKIDINQAFTSHIYRLRNNTKKIYMGGYMWMFQEDRNKMLLSAPEIVQLDLNYNIINKFYSIKDASLFIHKISGKHVALKSDLQGKIVKQRGTKKAGYIWMYYTDYIKHFNKQYDSI